MERGRGKATISVVDTGSFTNILSSIVLNMSIRIPDTQTKLVVSSS